MRCKYCDSDLPSRVPNCPFCGAPVEGFHTRTESDDKTDSSKSTTKLDGTGLESKEKLIDSKMIAAKIDGLDMRWYHIMIFVVLFLMAAMYCGMGIIMILGMYNHAELRTSLSNAQLYASFPNLRVVDVITGFIFIGVAGLTLATRKKLAMFKKDGPVSLVILFILMMCFPQVRIMMLGFATHQINAVRKSAFAPGFIQSFILLAVNYIYFRKRVFLFDQ